MAVKIQYTNQSATKLVTASSRYASSRIILLGEKGVPTFELYKNKNRHAYTRDTRWAQITPSVEYRPDLVSQELFGTPDFWWRIMEMNHMKDILEFKAGKTIMVPTSILA